MTEFTVKHYFDTHFTNMQKIEAETPADAIAHFKKMLTKEGCHFTSADVFEAEEDFI